MKVIQRLNKFKYLKHHCYRTEKLAEKFGKVLGLNSFDLV